MTTHWTKIKAEYLQNVPPRELAKKYKIKAKAISDRADHEGWRKEKSQISENVRKNVEEDIKDGATEAILYLREVVNNPDEKTVDRIAAAKGLLSVSGLEKSEKKITGDVNMSPTTFNILPVKGKDEL